MGFGVSTLATLLGFMGVSGYSFRELGLRRFVASGIGEFGLGGVSRSKTAHAA